MPLAEPRSKRCNPLERQELKYLVELNPGRRKAK